MNQPLWYFDFEALERYHIIPAASSWRLVILKKESISRKNELPCFRIFFYFALPMDGFVYRCFLFIVITN